MWVHNLESPDPQSKVPRVIAINVAFSATALLAVGFRFYVRMRLRRMPWVDDYAALASALLGAAYAGIAIAQTRWGLGLNAQYFPASNVVPFGKVQYAGGPVYCIAVLGFKVSLLSSYFRIGGFVKMYRSIIMVVIAACVCNQLIFTFILLFACQPVAKQWDATIPGHCINTVPSYYGLAGTSLGFDLLVIALPLPVLVKLQLRTRHKLALVGVFALGFFVTIIQILRIFTIKNLKTYTDSQPIVLWSMIEISLGVITTCIPTYGPLFRSFASIISSYGQGHTQTKSNTYALATRGGPTQRSSDRGRSPHAGRKLFTNQSDTPANTDTMTSTCFDPRDSELEILDDGTTTKGKGGGHSTTIMSTRMSVPAKRRDRDTTQRDSDDEELIRDRDRDLGSGRDSNGPGLRNGSPETPTEDPFHIHTMTEVKVEHEI